jgi:uncharacterized protein YdaU (DUF1376 family)
MTPNPKGKAPAFQFYAADWLADEAVSVMSLEEEGAYIRALCYCWREGSIPADEDRLARLLKGAPPSVVKVVTDCFTNSPSDDSRLIHPMLEKERAKQRDFSDRQRDKANRRWDSSDPTGDMPETCRDDAEAIPEECRSIAGEMPPVCSSTSTSTSTSTSSSIVSQTDESDRHATSSSNQSEDGSKTTASDRPPDERLARLMLFRVLEYTKEQVSDELYHLTVKDAEPGLSSHSFDEARSALAHVKTEAGKWWLEQLKKKDRPMLYFMKSLGSILKQMRTAPPPSKAEANANPKDALPNEVKGRDTSSEILDKWKPKPQQEKEI